MWTINFFGYFFGLSLTCAAIIWVWCYVADLQKVLGKVVPRSLRDYVVFEDFDGESTGLRPNIQVYRNKAQKAFLQMVVIDILLAPLLFPVNFLISSQMSSE